MKCWLALLVIFVVGCDWGTFRDSRDVGDDSHSGRAKDTYNTPPDETMPANPLTAMSFASALLTSSNRSYHDAGGSMPGGWAPHLRSLMRTSKGAFWFVVDAGPSLLENARLDYYSSNEGAWILRKQAPLPAGIQQNVASFMQENIVRSYGVNSANHTLEACVLDVDNVDSFSCSPVEIGGTPLALGESANYVGALLLKGSTKLVWWSEAGDAGAPGAWSYIYDSGNGWNGPVRTQFPELNNFAYVFGDALDSDEVVLGGQGFVGNYASDSDDMTRYRAMVGNLKLGEPLNLTQLTVGAENARAVEALLVFPENQRIHLLARASDGKLAYFSKAGNATWQDNAGAIETIESADRSRFVYSSAGFFLMHNGAANGLHVKRVDATKIGGAVTSWAAAEKRDLTVAERELGKVDAIWCESPAQQTVAVSGWACAVAGEYARSLDSEIWAFLAK